MKSRRNFIQKSSLIGLGSGLIGGFPNFLIAKDLKNNSPNDTINFGVIGCNGMGWSNMKSILKNKNKANIISIPFWTTIYSLNRLTFRLSEGKLLSILGSISIDLIYFIYI